MKIDLITKRYIALLLLLTLTYHVNAQSDLGIVWTREYDFAAAGNISSFTPQPLYLAATGQARYLLTGTEAPRMGFITMLDESGNQLKSWSIPIPSYYDKYTVESSGSKGTDISFERTFMSLYNISAPTDILASRISSAVMKADGSILAFGYVYRYRADAWSEGTPDYSPGSHAVCRMLTGVWKIRIDATGNVIENTTARGADAYKMLIYNDKILLPGLDIHEPANIGTAGTGGRGVGMLHEYDLNGNFVAERCPAVKDGDPVTGVLKTPDGNILLDGWNSKAVAINSTTYAIIQQMDATTVNPSAVNVAMSGRGTVEGGFFFNPQFSANSTIRTGATFAKLNPNGTLAYKVLNAPASRAIVYENPLVLDPENKVYVGTVNLNGVNTIYKITDKLDSYTMLHGDPYPNNTNLTDVSLKDGFFAMGKDWTTKKITVVKLSTCANFKLNVGAVTNYVPPGASLATRTISHTGNQASGTVSYSWILRDISADGNAISELTTDKTGTSPTLPTQTFTLLSGKTHGEAEYEITATDNYINNGVSQSCEQTYTIKVTVSKVSSTLFSDDVWFFGQNKSSAKTSKGIIFKNGVATDASNVSMVNSRENSLSVSTPACNGSFVFYASHDHVFNSLHQAMKGGIATNPLTDPGKFDGHTSNSDGLGAVYIGNNKYVLLSVTTEADVGDLIYYIVDMTKENGLGELSLGGTIDASKKVGEAIELIPKVGTDDEYWLIYYRSDVNKFFVYLLKGNNGSPTMTKVDEYASNLPQTTAHVYDIQANATFTSIVALHSNHFALFSFDPMTGKLVHRKTVDNGNLSGGLYSAEFSPNNKYLYLTDIWVPSAAPRLFQYDVTVLSNPTYVTSVAYSHANTSSGFQGGSTKIGPDGKMYIVRSNTNQMAVVNNPNAQLTAAGINLNGFKLSSSGGEDLHISTGLTPPWTNPSTSNTPPITVKDVVATATRYGTLVIKPLQNDNDGEDNIGEAKLNLSGASFVTATDVSKGALSWDPTTKEVTFVPNPLYNFVNGEKIHLNYIVKDVGIPVALCAEGEIEITWRFVIANNDIATALQKTPNNPIKVTLNDSIPVGCTPIVSIVTGPTHGTASVSELNILYTPTDDYTGPDALTYTISCGTQTSTATVAINVIKLPDNISDADCFLKDPPASAWGIKEVPFYTEIMHTLVSPIVGDIDGDGKSEIVALSKADQRTLRVISDKGVLLKSFTMPAAMDYESLAMARIKTASGIKGFIYAIVGTNIYGYNYETGSVWQASYTQKTSSQKTLNIADFNNDGFAEISCGGSIYDAETGYLLCSTSGNFGYTTGWVGASKTLSFPANIIGDEKLELVAGNKIFNVNITNRANSAVNSITLAKTINTPITTACGTYTPADGTTQVVDINNDGRLDVVVQDLVQATKTAWLYAWDAETEKLIAATCVSNVLSINIPLIGDVDGDQRPEMILMGSEIGYNTNGKDSLYAFVYDGTLLFKKKWTFKHADPSGATGLTLFDFNQDKTYELIYRDEKNLRILSVVGTTLIDRVSIPCLSYTGYEHPIVVDLDGDGSAEIITIGQSSGDYRDNKGPIRVFKSLNHPWAPARPVWNQYAYNAVNINDDLTIPRYQLNPATVFPGDDDKLDTNDDVRPYNAFLQQQTTLNKNGTPLWLAPNAEIGLPTPIFNYSAVGDSMQIKLVINNVGDAALQDPVNITVYKDAVGSTPKYTYAYPKSILAGASATISFAIPNFRTWLGVTNSTTQLIVKINDNGNGYNDQAVCDSTKVKALKPYGNLLMANTDHASGFTNKPITEKVLNNDSTATCTPGTLSKFDTIPASGLKNGSLVINTDSTFTYTPKLNFAGMDSVTYYIKCGADSSAARVYFLIVKPNSQTYTACPNAVVTVGVNAIAGVTYRWYTTAIGSTVATTTITKDASASQSLWVEAEYKGVKYPRIEVKVNLASSCGVTNPSGCAKDGTVIFKEDFGGNDINDPDVKATGIPQVIGYTYNGTGVGPNNYGIRKKGSSNSGGWFEVADHTFPGDYSRGYLLQVDGTVSRRTIVMNKK